MSFRGILQTVETFRLAFWGHAIFSGETYARSEHAFTGASLEVPSKGLKNTHLALLAEKHTIRRNASLTEAEASPRTTLVGPLGQEVDDAQSRRPGDRTKRPSKTW